MTEEEKLEIVDDRLRRRLRRNGLDLRKGRLGYRVLRVGTAIASYHTAADAMRAYDTTTPQQQATDDQQLTQEQVHQRAGAAMDGRLKWAVISGSKEGVFVQTNDGEASPRLYLEMRLSPCGAIVGDDNYALRVWCKYKRKYLVERQPTSQAPKQAQIDQAKFVGSSEDRVGGFGGS